MVAESSLITADPVAARLGTTAKHVYRLAAEGVIPPGVAVRVGRSVRFDPGRLEEWIASGGAGFSAGWRRGEDPRPAA